MSKDNKIIVGIDLSQSSLEVLKRAFQIAQTKDATLVIVHAIDKTLFEKYFSSPNDDVLLQKAQKKIEEEIENISHNGVDYSLIIKMAAPVKLIIDVAKEIEPDLIVIGVNAEDNFKTKVFGSTSIKTIQNSKLPVLIVKNNCAEEYQNILAFTDLSEVSAKSIRFTQNFFEKCTIKAIYAYKQLTDLVLTYYNSMDEKDEIQKKIVTDAVNNFDLFKKENNIMDSEIIEVSHGINNILLTKSNELNSDLVVIGSNGVNDAGSFLYGSIALYMIENVESDILVYVPKKD